MVDLKYKILIMARHLVILVLYISHAIITFLKKSDANRYHFNIHFYSLENLGKDMSIRNEYKVFRKIDGRR